MVRTSLGLVVGLACCQAQQSVEGSRRSAWRLCAFESPRGPRRPSCRGAAGGRPARTSTTETSPSGSWRAPSRRLWVVNGRVIFDNLSHDFTICKNRWLFYGLTSHRVFLPMKITFIVTRVSTERGSSSFTRFWRQEFGEFPGLFGQ